MIVRGLRDILLWLSATTFRLGSVLFVVLYSAPSVPQPVFTITEKAPTSVLIVKAVVATFNQEKALVGAFSVIVQLHRLIVYTALVIFSIFLGNILIPPW